VPGLAWPSSVGEWSGIVQQVFGWFLEPGRLYDLSTGRYQHQQKPEGSGRFPSPEEMPERCPAGVPLTCKLQQLLQTSSEKQAGIFLCELEAGQHAQGSDDQEGNPSRKRQCNQAAEAYNFEVARETGTKAADQEQGHLCRIGWEAACALGSSSNIGGGSRARQFDGVHDKLRVQPVARRGILRLVNRI
jgi:hypothetical protein